MADGQPEETAAQMQRDDVYSQRSDPAFEAVLESRTAARDAAFFPAVSATWDASDGRRLRTGNHHGWSG
jgi:hypothetical protein